MCLTWKEKERKRNEKSLFTEYYLCTQQNFMKPKLIHNTLANY